VVVLDYILTAHKVEARTQIQMTMGRQVR